MLGVPPINSALDAVRSVIVNEGRNAAAAARLRSSGRHASLLLPEKVWLAVRLDELWAFIRRE